VKGAAEEQLALDYLQRQGLKPLLRNFRARGGELDLVMRDGDTLAVIEVRKRSHPGFGSAAESVDARKRARIVLAAQRLLAEHPQFARLPVRFDVVTLDRENRLEWLKAAFDSES